MGTAHQRKAIVRMSGIPAGTLVEIDKNVKYTFTYAPEYKGLGVSVRLPTRAEPYEFNSFPPFFDGLLPEGVMLESLLRQLKIDREDYFAQLVAVGKDLAGAVTVEEDIS